MKGDKKLGLVQILELIKAGLCPAQISKKYSIPKQTISYYVDKLKKLECIERQHYGVWKHIKDIKEVPIRPKGSIGGQIRTSPEKEIRGHAFIWKIEFVKPYDWNVILKYYKKKKLSFSLICNGKVPRTIFNDRKIWLTKRGFTIYEPIDFLGKSSFEVKGMAVYQMDRLIKNLLKELGQKFRQYRFTTSREHYGIIRNELARQYNDRKEKMHIKGEDGTTWMWIDDSKGLGELENDEPNINRQVQNFWNSHKKHGFKADANFIMENFKESAKQIKKNAKNADYHMENMRSHVGATRDLSGAAKILNKSILQQKKSTEKTNIMLGKLLGAIHELNKK